MMTTMKKQRHEKMNQREWR